MSCKDRERILNAAEASVVATRLRSRRIRDGTLTGPNFLSLSHHCRRRWVLDL
jgi:hypothetical protein